jgi:hypothetical protein
MLALALWCAGHALGLSQSTWLIDDDRIVVDLVMHQAEAPLLPIDGDCLWHLDSDELVAGDGRSLRWSAPCAFNTIGWTGLGVDHRHEATWAGTFHGNSVWSGASPSSRIDPRRWWVAAWMAMIIAVGLRKALPVDVALVLVSLAIGVVIGAAPLAGVVLAGIALTVATGISGPGTLGLVVAATIAGTQLSMTMAIIAGAAVGLAAFALHAKRSR